MAKQRPVSIVSHVIREWIREGRWAAGEMIDSELAIAKELDFSRGTVRSAIDVLVSTGELTRKPHSRPTVGLSKESIESSGLDVCVWVSHPISDGGSLLFMRGVSLGLRGTPFRMTVREPTRFYGEHVQLDERQFLIDLLNNDQAAGAIVDRDPFADNRDLYELVIRAGKKIVFVDTLPPQGISADYVGTANEAASRRIVEHLIEQGHRSIAFFTGCIDSPVVAARYRGYLRAMSAAALKTSFESFDRLPAITTDPIVPAGRFASRTATHGYYFDGSQKLLRAFLELSERPTAIVADCDVLAHSLCGLLEGIGLGVPEQVSIAGFDHLARWSDDPDDLTSAGQDLEGFGWHAAELLLERVERSIRSEPRHLLLQAPLVIRSSSNLRPDFRSAGELPGNVAK